MHDWAQCVEEMRNDLNKPYAKIRYAFELIDQLRIHQIARTFMLRMHVSINENAYHPFATFPTPSDCQYGAIQRRSWCGYRGKGRVESIRVYTGTVQSKLRGPFFINLAEGNTVRWALLTTFHRIAGYSISCLVGLQ